MKILVTGGAGYIGSHVAKALQDSGYSPIALDDMSVGLANRLTGVPLIQLDLAGPNAKAELVDLFGREEIGAVIHLAARKSVAESVARPEFYYQQNIGAMISLLAAMQEAQVMKLVFSSSAAIYGSPEVEAVDEDYPCKPINPYGETKLIGELLTSNAAQAWGLKAVSLRYFNVAGAGFGIPGDNSISNLIPIAIEAVKANSPISVFGTDWPSSDGSCVRDYIHVHDLADAHIRALEYLDKDSRLETVFNVGTGKGSTVFEVLAALEVASGKTLEIQRAGRRAGDPAFLTADVSRIEKTLGWKAHFGLSEIVESAYQASQQ